MKFKFWDCMEFYSPKQIRLLARRKEKGKRVIALTDEELAIASGLPIDRVQWIYWQDSWEDIPFGQMKAFIDACHFDPTSSADRNRARAYLHQKRGSPKYAYLRDSPCWAAVFRPLILDMARRKGAA